MIISQSLSRKKIRNIVNVFRNYLGLSDVLYFPVMQVLENINRFDCDAYFEVVQKEELETAEAHAETDILNKCIKIRQDVYDRACAGYGRDRLTIAHELGHFILILLCGIKFHRSFDGEQPKAYNDPEWQAKCFAGELLIPAHLIKNMTAEEVALKCGVSFDAAEFQLSKIA